MMNNEATNGMAINNNNAALLADTWACKRAFRSKNPEGKIAKKLIQLQDGIALVEARVYLDKNDPEDGFIANAFGQFQLHADTNSTVAIEVAETAAIGRALSDAGYGEQYSADSPTNAQPVETPKPTRTRAKLLSPAPTKTDATEAVDSSADAVVTTATTAETDETNATDAITTPIVEASAESAPTEVTETVTTVSEAKPAIEAPEAAPTASSAAPKYTAESMLDEILAHMTVDEAKKVEVPFNTMKGKTLGEIAIQQPKTLLWIVNSYSGPSDILRAGAKILIDATTEKSA